MCDIKEFGASGSGSITETEILQKKVQIDPVSKAYNRAYFYEKAKEMIQDTIMMAINDAMRKVDEETQDVMGAFTGGMPGFF